MSGPKPLLSVLAGTPVTPRPLWLMRQAGRYLPEYRKLRASVPDFLSLCFSPDLATEVTLQPIRRFAFDAAILFSDILVLPHALGQRVWFEEGEGPRLAPFSLRTLDAAAAPARLAPVMETVAKVRAELPRSCTLIGFAGAPWTVATYMLAGKGGDGASALLAFERQSPDDFELLISLLVEATAGYLLAQIDAGAHTVQIFESWAGSVPPHLLESGSLHPIARIVDRVRAHSPRIPVIVFPRGAGANYPRYADETGATAISVDQDTPLRVSGARVVQGNLDPLALLEGGSRLQSSVKKILEDTAGLPHIFNLGHGILPQTPVAHVEELVRLVRNGK